jgi:hypothetical protein
LDVIIVSEETEVTNLRYVEIYDDRKLHRHNAMEYTTPEGLFCGEVKESVF